MYIHDHLLSGHTLNQKSMSWVRTLGPLSCLELYSEFLNMQHPLGFLARNWYCLSLWGDSKDWCILPSSQRLSKHQGHPICLPRLPDRRPKIIVRGQASLPIKPGLFKSLDNLVMCPIQTASTNCIHSFQGIRDSYSIVLRPPPPAAAVSGNLLEMHTVGSTSDLLNQKLWE